MAECESVVSCVGGFGATDAYMGLVNGDCNMKLAETAKVCTHYQYFNCAYKHCP
jgi:hypothetical protein